MSKTGRETPDGIPAIRIAIEQAFGQADETDVID